MYVHIYIAQKEYMSTDTRAPCYFKGSVSATATFFGLDRGTV